MRRKLTLVLVLFLVFSVATVSVQGVNPGESDELVRVVVTFDEFRSVDSNQEIPGLGDIVHSNSRAVVALYEDELVARFPEVAIRHKVDFLFPGISMDAKEDIVSSVSSLPFVADIFTVSDYVPTGNFDPNQIINASAVYDMVDSSNVSVNGSGILVGVIDSGIDYNHKHLGDGIYGEAGKVVGGTNYVERGEEPVDDSPICHGTSVAGLIAASRDSVSIASGAKLMSYRVYSNKNPKVSEDTIVKAIDQAVKDGCQVINVSLSTPGGDSSKPSAVGKAVNKALNSGVVVVGSAGEFGTYCNHSDKGTVGGAGLSTDAISVGAMDSRPGFKILINDELYVNAMASTPYSKFSTGKGMQLVDGGYGSEDELSSVSMRGKIVLVERGPSIGRSIPFYKKMLNAKRKGAEGVICWNDSPGELVSMQVGYDYELGNDVRDKDMIPTCFVSNKDGELLKRLVLQGEVNLSIDEMNFDTITRTTSIGPAEDLTFKPDVCAPGMGLTAPLSVSVGSGDIPYTVGFNGTSASTGIVSGAAALLKQYHPEWTPSQVRLALMNTSVPVRNLSNNSYASFLIQGAGRVNVDAAANISAFISPGGVIAKPNEKITLDVEGIGSDTTFNVSIEVPETLSEYVEFDISAESVKVESGSAASLDITPYFNQSKMPCNIECVVWFEAGSSKLHVPLICWKEFSSVSRSGFTGLQVAGDKIDYNASGNEISVDYNIALGDLYSYKPFAYGEYGSSTEETDTNQTILSRCQIDLVDGNNDSWISISQCENAEYGNYRVSWDGLDPVTGDQIPNGDYKIKLTRVESRVQESGSFGGYIESITAEQPIKIVGSKVPSPPKFVLYSRPGNPSIEQKFIIDLYLTNARDVSSFSMDIVYPTDEIEILDVIPGDFMGLDGVAVEDDMFNEEEEGKIRLFSKRMGESGISGHGLIARFVARCDDVVYPTIGYSSKRLLDSDGNLIRHMSYPLELEITEDEFVEGDLNFDGVVDGYDVLIFARSFGLTTRHPDYNIVADINDDGRVDQKDYKKLIANFGKHN